MIIVAAYPTALATSGRSDGVSRQMIAPMIGHHDDRREDREVHGYRPAQSTRYSRIATVPNAMPSA